MMSSGETLLVSATADVMLYDDATKQWLRPDDVPGSSHGGMASNSTNCGAPNMTKLSNIQLLQENNGKLGFRIVAVRINDRKLLINQSIFHKLKYQAATTSFHQWRNEHRQVLGLSFPSEPDAQKFHSVVAQAMEYLAGEHAAAAAAAGNVGPGGGGREVYQDPHYGVYQAPPMAQQQHHPAGINGAAANNGQMVNGGGGMQPQYRKTPSNQALLNLQHPQVQPSQAIYGNHQQPHQVPPMAAHPQHHFPQHHQSSPQQALPVVGPPPAVISAASIQRRASQGSNNSCSTTNSSGPPVPPPPPPPPPPMPNGVPYVRQQSQSAVAAAAEPPTPTLPPSNGVVGIPPIAANAPPPPPPPSAAALKQMVGGGKVPSFAEQLKQTQLKKVQSNGANPPVSNPQGLNRTSSSSNDTGLGASSGSSNGSSSSKNSTISSTNSAAGASGTHSDLLSELAATINRRKNKADGIASAEQKSQQPVKPAPGGGAMKPWQQKQKDQQQTVNGSQESPKVHRKVPSGSSLSSQEEPLAVKPGLNSIHQTSHPTVNGPCPSSSSSTGSGLTTPNTSQAVVTLADLERFKQELLVEFQRELHKAKQEILTALTQQR